MHSLEALFKWSTVAVVGASESTNYGSGPSRALKELGFAGHYYPVNPRRAEVHGVRAYSEVSFGTSPQAVASMLSGEMPLNTGISGTQIVAANRKGGTTLLLASSVNTFPFSILAQSTIKTVADLKGKKFGISQFGSASDTASRMFLAQNNLDPSTDVTLIQTGGLPQTLAALQANGLDAVC